MPITCRRVNNNDIIYISINHFRGINDGFQDGLVAGRHEGLKEGFREGFKSGREFGTRVGNFIVPLLQILQSDSTETNLIESARKLLSEIGNISLTNEEDPEKESHLSQIEAKIKALTVNFTKKVKNTSINRINKSSKDELSF